MQIKEAQGLNIGYKAIKKIALIFQKELINNIFDLDVILCSIGAKIALVDSTSFESCKNFFCYSSPEDFKITVLNDNEPLKRVFLAQALGNYILHTQGGIKPCKVLSVSNTPAAKESFYFSLVLLLRDEEVIKMIREGFTNKQISNLFRVPEKIVEIKKVILRNNGEI